LGRGKGDNPAEGKRKKGGRGCGEGAGLRVLDSMDRKEENGRRELDSVKELTGEY